MLPFKRRSRLPENWKEAIRDCDFHLARIELQSFFDMANREARAQGQEVCFRKEFVTGWQSFSADPRFETAVAFVEKEPEYGVMLLPYFIECCPGGRFKIYEKLLGPGSPTQTGGNMDREKMACPKCGSKNVKSGEGAHVSSQTGHKVKDNVRPRWFCQEANCKHTWEN